MRTISFRSFAIRCFALTVLCALPLSAQPLASRVLVVYNSSSSDSTNVALHYIAARGIPAQNLCAINPPSVTYLSLDDYASTVKTPIQQCLNTIGSSSILYIVFSYLTPYDILMSDHNMYSLDQYVADIWDQYAKERLVVAPAVTHPYYFESQAQGNVYARFQSFASFRGPATYVFYSVWRLDGPSAAIATALVDNAISAEQAGGPSGQACIDQRSLILPNYADADYRKGDWDLYRAGQFFTSAGLNTTVDTNYEEFGTLPAPLTCEDLSGHTALYSGWYSLNNYNGPSVFSWVPGSIGFHLDSYSAGDPRGGANWSGNALLYGITVTSGAVNEPYLEGLPRPGGVYRNLLEGANVGDAFLRNTRWLKWMILNVGDPLYTPYPGGRAPFNPPPLDNSLGLNPRELVGSLGNGNLNIGTITLSAPAPPPYGTTFTLSSNDPLASVPATVTVPAGSSQATFQVTTSLATGSTGVGITATADTLILQNTLIVDPLLSQLLFIPSTASAGQAVAGTVYLNDHAPVGGAMVLLSSSDPSTTPPASVTVPAGMTSANFQVPTTPVNVSTNALITATYAGATTSASITIQPAIQWEGFYPDTVAAGDASVISLILATPAPPGGATINLSNDNPSVVTVPATLLVPAGQTYTNYLAYTNSAATSGSQAHVTLSYGGDAKTATVSIR